MYDKKYFQDYKEQSFKWEFWASYIRKKTKTEDNILEIGCTYGFLFNYLKDYKNKYGIDISEHAIKQARILSQGAEYKVMDAEKLTLKKDLFSLVLAIDVMEHLKHPEKGIQEVHRVLKHNGMFIMVTPNLESLSHKEKEKAWFAYKDPTHISILSEKDWIKLLEKNRFRIVKLRTIDCFDFPYINKFFCILNLILYKLGIPFNRGKWADNLVIIARKN